MTDLTQQNDRKSRLAALASRAGRNNQKDENEEDATTTDNVTEEKSKKEIKFRNYQPQSLSLKKEEKRRKKQQDDDEIVTKKPKLAVEEALKVAQLQIDFDAEKNHHQEALTKKVNWDLKRDIMSSIQKLEKRTQRAIVNCLRERLVKEAGDAVNEDNLD
mmetsp:Transcript_16379/g.18886  ORF Transcript_16379/g.18886 Transcript_16379/m.18886 type:complete len:160 (-) Transcript_16379:77-556(-)